MPDRSGRHPRVSEAEMDGDTPRDGTPDIEAQRPARAEPSIPRIELHQHVEGSNTSKAEAGPVTAPVPRPLALPWKQVITALVSALLTLATGGTIQHFRTDDEYRQKVDRMAVDIASMKHSVARLVSAAHLPPDDADAETAATPRAPSEPEPAPLPAAITTAKKGQHR